MGGFLLLVPAILSVFGGGALIRVSRSEGSKAVTSASRWIRLSYLRDCSEEDAAELARALILGFGIMFVVFGIFVIGGAMLIATGL